jgi:hypothetical protein
MDIVLPMDVFGVIAYTFFVIAATLTCYWFLGKKDSPDNTKWAIVWVFWGAMFVFCVLVVANYVISADTVKKDIYNRFYLLPKGIAAKACPYITLDNWLTFADPKIKSNFSFDINATLDANKTL